MMKRKANEKVWTIVIEVTVSKVWYQKDVEDTIYQALRNRDELEAFKILEVIDAPYGPAGVTVKFKDNK